MSQQSTISVCVHEADGNLFQTENIINTVFCTQYKHTGYCVAEHTVGRKAQLPIKEGICMANMMTVFVCLQTDIRDLV